MWEVSRSGRTGQLYEFLEYFVAPILRCRPGVGNLASYGHASALRMCSSIWHFCLSIWLQLGSPLMQSNAIRQLVFWVCVLLGTAVIYLPGLGNALVFDDNRLTDGTVFDDYGALAPLKQRLLSYGSFVWAADLFGEGWWKQRLINLAVHLGTVWGLWVLVRGLMQQVNWPENDDGGQPSAASRDAAATVGVLLFALNPVAVYAVAYLIQRSILMATLFGVWALVLTMIAARRRQPLWLIAAVFAYAGAVLGKEHAVLLPLPAIALYLIIRPLSRIQLAAVGGLGLLCLSLAIGFLVQRYAGILGTAFDANSAAFVAELGALKPGIEDKVYALSVANQGWLFFNYGLLWVLPNVEWMSIDLRPAFPLAMTSFPHVLGLPLYAAVLLGAAWMMWRYTDWRRYVGFALFTPAALFGTEFATVWIQDPFVLYRSYLWAIGLPFLFALPFVGSRPQTVIAIGLVIAVGFAALAFERVGSLKTEFSTWDDAARKIDLQAPPNALGRSRAFLNRGNQFVIEQRVNLAANDYATAARLGDRSGSAEYHLGSVLQAAGQFEQALAAFERAEAGTGMRQFAHLLPTQKADLLARMGRHAEALVQADKALSFPQLDTEDRIRMFNTRARSNIRAGNTGAALKDYDALIALAPNNRSHRIGRALTLAHAGLHEDALAALAALPAQNKDTKPGASKEGDGEVLTARAIVLSQMGNREAAVAEARAALAAQPGNPAPKALLQQLGAD